MADENGQPGGAPAPDANATDDAAAAAANEALNTEDGAGGPGNAMADGDDGGGAQHAADWPEDWKDKMAGEDADFRKRLDRFASPIEVAGWGKNSEKMWKQGADPDPYPDEGSEEDQGKWRADHGLPETAAGYEKLIEGMEIKEDMKEEAAGFFEMAHAKNWSPAQVKEAITYKHEFQAKAQQAQDDTDLEHRNETMDALRQEYGAELKPHMAAGKALFDDAPEGLMDMFLSARLENGKRVGSDPEMVRWMISTALKANPGATVVPGTDTSTTATSIAKEMADLETMMADTKGEYYVGPKSEIHQKRYAELLGVKERLDARANR